MRLHHVTDASGVSAAPPLHQLTPRGRGAARGPGVANSTRSICADGSRGRPWIILSPREKLPIFSVSNKNVFNVVLSAE